jgi:hypothetical protein
VNAIGIACAAPATAYSAACVAASAAACAVALHQSPPFGEVGEAALAAPVCAAAFHAPRPDSERHAPTPS